MFRSTSSLRSSHSAASYEAAGMGLSGNVIIQRILAAKSRASSSDSGSKTSYRSLHNKSDQLVLEDEKALTSSFSNRCFQSRLSSACLKSAVAASSDRPV